MKIKVEGNSELLVKADAWVRFGIVCAKCYKPLTIATILHFADYPQVSVEPCSCPPLTKKHQHITNLATLWKAGNNHPHDGCTSAGADGRAGAGVTRSDGINRGNMIYDIMAPGEEELARPRHHWHAIPTSEEFSRETEFLLLSEVLSCLEAEMSRIKTLLKKYQPQLKS